MNKLLIKFILWFKPLWRSLGVDSSQLEIILQTKLLMDSRRVSSFNMGSAGQKKEKKGQDLLAMFLYFIFGGAFLLIFVELENMVTGLTIYFAAWMVSFAMTIITDFTEVLIDVRDNYIILPRPVNDRTLTVARILHIVLYLSKLMLAFSIPGILFFSIKFGFAGMLIFFLMLFISVLLVIFLVNLVYLLILNFVSPAKFKEIINYFQIAFSVGIFGAYYLLPRLIDFESIASVDVINNPESYWVPPVWIASIWGVLADQDYRTATVVMSGMALVAPFICIWFVTKVLAKNFSQKMMALGEGKSEKGTKKQAKIQRSNSFFNQFLAAISHHRAEQAFIEWIWRLTQRKRDYKLRVYPAFAFVPIFFVYFALNGEGSLAERFADMANNKSYLLLIYFGVLLMSIPVINSRFSDQYRAAWIVQAMPVETPGYMLTATIKVVMFRYFLPFYIFMLLVGCSIWGLHVLDDFLLGFLNIVLLLLLQLNILPGHIPFSKDWTEQNKGSNFTNNFLYMIIGGIFGGLHYLLTMQAYLVPAGILISAVILALLYRSTLRLGWGYFRN